MESWAKVGSLHQDAEVLDCYSAALVAAAVAEGLRMWMKLKAHLSGSKLRTVSEGLHCRESGGTGHCQKTVDPVAGTSASLFQLAGLAAGVGFVGSAVCGGPGMVMRLLVWRGSRLDSGMSRSQGAVLVPCPEWN